MSVVTPTLRKTARRWAFWIVFALALITVAILSLARGGQTLGSELDPESAAPRGTKALVEVLQQEGVRVTLADSLDETADALRGGDPATVLVHDRDRLLADTDIDVAGLGTHLVLLNPDYAALDAVTPEIAPAGSVIGTLQADCALPAVDRAGAVTGDGAGYRHLGDGDIEACLGSGDGIHSLLRLADGERTISVLGTTDALSNEHIAEAGNAALALGLLGEHPHLVWYVPGGADLPAATPQELTPGWVTPVLVLLVIVTIAVGIAQGRRLGPLVVENLPVTVRSTETMEGRARLYQRSSARLRALDALRIGSIRRLAARVRLPQSADVATVAAMVAGLTGRSPQAVRALLIDEEPGNDRDLIRLSDELLELERAVEEATRP